jgi:exonuclease III
VHVQIVNVYISLTNYALKPQSGATCFRYHACADDACTGERHFIVVYNRAIGAVIHSRGVKIFVCSVYLPSGLDGVGATSAKAHEAHRILALVCGWMARSGASRCVVAGDFNATSRGGRAHHVGEEWSVSAKDGFDAFSMITATGMVDAFARSNPRWGIRDAFTRKGNVRGGGVSLSRIDYVFVTSTWWEESAHTNEIGARCSVHDTATASDHRALDMNVVLPTKGSRRWKPPESPKRGPCVQGVPTAKLRAAARAVERAVGSKRKMWQHRLQRPSGRPADTLDEIQREFSETLLGAVRPILPPNRRKAKKYKSRVVRRARRNIRLLWNTRNMIDDIIDGNASGTDARWARCVAKLHEEGLAPHVLPPAARDWGEWRNAVQTRLRSDRIASRRAVSDMSDHPSEYLRTAFHHTKRTGRFFREVFGKKGGAGLRSAVDPSSGKRTHEPREYKKIIRDLVKEPFSHPHTPRKYSKKWLGGMHGKVRRRSLAPAHALYPVQGCSLHGLRTGVVERRVQPCIQGHRPLSVC